MFPPGQLLRFGREREKERKEKREKGKTVHLIWRRRKKGERGNGGKLYCPAPRVTFFVANGGGLPSFSPHEYSPHVVPLDLMGHPIMRARP